MIIIDIWCVDYLFAVMLLFLINNLSVSRFDLEIQIAFKKIVKWQLYIDTKQGDSMHAVFILLQ